MATLDEPPPVARPRRIARIRARIFRFFEDKVWTLDALIIVNLVVLGFELETGEILDTWRKTICAGYLLEMTVRFFKFGRAHFLHVGRVLDLGIVCAAAAGVLLLGEAGTLWRLTALRGARLARIADVAAAWHPTKELWLVLTSFRVGLRALVWFAGVLLAVVFSCAAAAMGLAGQGGDAEACAGAAMREGLCVNKQELFGSIGRAMLTVFQLLTGEGWADLARALSSSKPLAAVFITGFVVVSSYGLVSVFIGVLVNSTVRLARTHSTHDSQMGITEDKKTIGALRAFIDVALAQDGRSSMRMRDLKELLHVPSVSRAIEGLQLPFKDHESMFQYFDHNKKGILTAEEFTDGLLRLRRPSNANDMTALTARVGGSVTYVKRMGARAERLQEGLHDLRHILATSYQELAKLAEPGEFTMDEVLLRRDGVIKNSDPPVPPRYTM